MRVFLRVNAKNIKTVQPPFWTATLSDLCHLSILLTGKPSIYKGRAFFPSSDSLMVDTEREWRKVQC